MKTKITVTRRIPVEEYGFAEYVMESEVGEGEVAADVMGAMKIAAEQAHAMEKEEEKAKAQPKKSAAKAKAEPEPEEEEEEEVVDEEAAEEEEGENEESSEEEVEEEEAPPKEDKNAKKSTGKTAPSGEKKKTFKKKPAAYSRSSEQHKELFSAILKEVSPDWKKSEDKKARAKVVSQKMEGKDFLDSDGDVLPEFKAEVKKMMAAKK